MSAKLFGIFLGNKVIWRTDPMNGVMVWLLNKHGLSYRALGEQLGVTTYTARRMAKDGQEFVSLMQSMERK